MPATPTPPTSPTPRLLTDRLELGPLAVDDAGEMVDVMADPDLFAVIGGVPPTLAQLDERYTRWAAGSPIAEEAWHNWIVRLRAGGAAIGHLQATVVRGGHAADVGWLIGTPWQGQGYATEAARAVVSWLAAAGVRAITAHIRAGHAPSERVAAAAGLTSTDRVEDGEVVWDLRPAGSAYLAPCPARRPVTAALRTPSTRRRPTPT